MTPGEVLPGATVKAYNIDTAMYVAQRAIIGDVRWRTLLYCADGYFAEEVWRLAESQVYIPCTCSYYNFYKQNFV